MPATSLADHIKVYADALSPTQCRTLIERFEGEPQREACRVEEGYSFEQIDVTERWPDQNQMLVPIFLAYFQKYQLALNARFWPPSFCFEHLRIKRYLPNGRDSFPLHVDVLSHAAARRFMTAFIYLNGLAGGETSFPDLDIVVAPEPGKLIAFPPIWLFPHAGAAPQTDAKYILHTYLCYPA
jgi:prolyl 4-hydroxylase